MLTHFEDEFLTLPNLDFITAQSSLITAQMGSVTPLFQALTQVMRNKPTPAHTPMRTAKEDFQDEREAQKRECMKHRGFF